MIQITLYQNGFEIKGHAVQCICGEVSILAWAYSNSISVKDKTHQYYTSALDNKENPNEGYTWMTFDNTNKEALWLFEEYVLNAKAWGKEQWPENAVQIVEEDEILVK